MPLFTIGNMLDNPDWSEASIEAVCATLARLFRVRDHEIALLRVWGRSLEFVYPVELKAAGTIPLSSSAVAARTANSQRAEFFNDFANVAHMSVFELVPLGTSARPDFNPDRIQKLMSAPVIDRAGRVLGVVQISRKGPTPDAAGADFEGRDLQNLRETTRHLVPLFTKLVQAH